LDELAVAKTVDSRCGVDTNDPETTEITLLGATVAVRKLKRLFYSKLC
jgi:hypothetical protein